MKSYVDFHLDIRKFVLPDNYLIFFSVVEFTDKCFLFDYIDKASSQEPVVDVVSSPKLELRPGDEKAMQLNLKASLDLQNASISGSNLSEISITFVNNSLDFDSSGRAFPVSIVKVAPNAPSHEYSVPIVVNYSLPNAAIHPVLFKEIEATPSLPLTVGFTEYVQVDVLNPYLDIEKINNYLINFTPIISIVGLILAGIGIFYTKSKK